MCLPTILFVLVAAAIKQDHRNPALGVPAFAVTNPLLHHVSDGRLSTLGGASELSDLIWDTVGSQNFEIEPEVLGPTIIVL